jgi:predicted dehydrogenase
MNERNATRREFLRTSIIAGAAFAACGFAGVAKAQATAEAPLRWGVIGTGHRGGIHIGAIKSFKEQCKILGVCDVMENHLAAGAKRAGEGVQTYSDYQKLLSNNDINAVLIATPNCVHKEVVVAALQAGKHVMCEKPMAVSMEECRAMKAAAEAKPDLVVLYTMQLRYSPRFNAMRQAIESGKIGKPKMLLFVESRGDWNRGDVWRYDDPKQGKVNWRFSQRASGGTLNEKSCHFLDLLHWMAGEMPQRVTCNGGIAKYRDGRDTWDHATISMRYPSGALATHTLCMFGPKRMDFQVIGEEAALLIEDAGPGGTPLLLQSKGKQEPVEVPAEVTHGERGRANGEETAVLRMYEDFFACVKNKKKPQMDANKAMVACQAAWLGELSSEKKREVSWDDLG